MLDDKFKWTEHANYLRSKLRKLIHAFRNLSLVLPLEIMRMAYYAYVESILSYGIIIWGGASRSTLEPLAVVQRAVIKAALRLPVRTDSNIVYSMMKVFDI